MVSGPESGLRAMGDSKEMRRLKRKWESRTGWPKRLEWIEIDGLRGWTAQQRIEFGFPLMAVVGENGVGKSTILQAAASIYKSGGDGKGRFASDFFPDTAWDRITKASIRYSVREGQQGGSIQDSIRKPGERWRGNPQRRERGVKYIDLSRIQPVAARLGYSQLANPALWEVSSRSFDDKRRSRLSQIMGRVYNLAKFSIASEGGKRPVPVIGHGAATYSGFHQGAGETTIAELLEADTPKYGMVLIDEVETSLHPRAQRRLVRHLAELCRERELQVIITTHSPYVLDELPHEARLYVMDTPDGKALITGVSPEFAMTKMDDVPQYECDLFVEDERAKILVREILAAHGRDFVQRCQLITYGAASVGQALGSMVIDGRFPRPSAILLDGDQAEAPGCILVPGGDAPERVVFEALAEKNWCAVFERVGREFAQVADACNRAMSFGDHHLWVDTAGSALVLSGDVLWQAMCAEWSAKCLSHDDTENLLRSVQDLLEIPETKLPRTMPTQTSFLSETHK